MTYSIRDAVHADLPAIREIYNDAVLKTTAIWNEQAVDLGNRQAWFSAAGSGLSDSGDRRQPRRGARLRFVR
jgi:L-amino acid N-acyltransferase